MNRIVYSLFILICFVFVGSEVEAQFNWRHHGPEGMGNRTRTIIFDNDGNLLAGSAGGGLWKSTNDGVSWKKVISYDANGGNPNITSMVRKGSTIYVGTGEVEFLDFAISVGSKRSYDPASPNGLIGNMGLPGGGVYISNDNGATWSNNNATTKDFPTESYDGPFISIQKLTITKSGRIFIATRRGLYYSDSPNLTSLKKSKGSILFENLPMMEVTATDGDIVLAAPSSFNYPNITVDGNTIIVDNNDSLYISKNKGVSFEAVTDADLYDQNFFSRVRTRIEAAPSNPNVVYVASSRKSSVNEIVGVWRSDDKGVNWKRIAPPGAPDFSPLGNTSRDAFTLSINPEDENGIIISGRNWYTFDENDGWITTIQHTNPTRLDYLPRPIYCVTYDPDNAKRMFVGTGSKIMRSEDGGVTFTQKSGGYGGTVTYSATSVGLQGSESIIAGTPFQGTILNNTWWRAPYNEDTNPGGPATTKGFGLINRAVDGKVAASYLRPGSVIIQGDDRGLLRSDGTFGSSFERFYGFPLNADSTGKVLPLNGITGTDIFIDRPNATSGGGGLADNSKLAPHAVWELDERIPKGVVGDPDATLAELQALPGKDSLLNIDNYVFIASSKYIWIGNYTLGTPNGLNPRWDRITNDLVSDPAGDEYFSAMAVSNDGKHTVYVGTSKGNIWRITGATNFETYDGTTLSVNVTKISDVQNSPFIAMKGRWISDLAVDPQDPSRLAITFAGYGGGTALSYVWLATNILVAPTYSFMSKAPKTPTYTVEFVPYQPQPNNPSIIESILMIGNEEGLHSTKDISAGGEFKSELPASFGNIAVYDIYTRKYSSVLIDEDTKEYRLKLDNTVFVATHGYGVWSTADTKLKGSRIGPDPETPETIDAYAVSLYPNPNEAGEFSSLKFELPENAFVDISMYGLDGRKMATYAQGEYEAGVFEQMLDTRSLTPGIYLIEVKIIGETEHHTKTLKAVIRR